MRKITILFAFISFSVFSQEADVAVYLEKTETVTFEQYDFIKKVNQYYPDLLVTRQVRNVLKNNLKVQELIISKLVFEIPSDCKFYYVDISADNAFMNYSYKLLDDTYIYGDVRLFNGQVFRTLFKVSKNKRVVQFFVDSKLLNNLEL